MRPRRRGDVLVLCYHAVSERWPAPLAVSPSRLERQLTLLVERGYRGVRFADAVGAAPFPMNLAVTFDDAYRSVLELALPILSRLGLPGTVFAVTELVGQAPMSWPGIDRWLGTPEEPELAGLSWDELRGLADAGWEIGSHSRSHPRLTTRNDDEIRRELRGSRQAVEERIGAPCASIAYPYGDVDDRVVAAAREAGYSAGAALDGRLRSTAALRWPRIGVYRSDAAWRFRLKVSPSVRRLRGSRAWAAVELGRAALRPMRTSGRG